MIDLHDTQGRDTAHSITVATPRDLASALTVRTVQAIFLKPGPTEAWEREVSAEIRSGSFRVPRAVLAGLTIDGAAAWLERNIPRTALTPAARDALLSSILELFHLEEEISRAEAFRFRIHTDVPNRRCGFHVDTVAPGLSVWGILRVFNGPGTLWVDPNNVKSMADFYGWLHRRDGVVRRRSGDGQMHLAELDDGADFLIDPSAIRTVSPGTTVVFRHLDATRHWSQHTPDAAWIHSSPMGGCARLVVNITADRAQRHRRCS